MPARKQPTPRRRSYDKKGSGTATIREVFEMIAQLDDHLDAKTDELKGEMYVSMNAMRDRHHDALDTISKELLRLTLSVEDHIRMPAHPGTQQMLERTRSSINKVVFGGSATVASVVVADMIVRLLHK